MYLTQIGKFTVLTYHHLVTEFVIEGVGEESCDWRQSVDHI